MHVPFQLRLPIGDATGMHDALVRLRAAHDADLAKLEKKLKTNPSDAVLREQVALAERGRRLSIHGLVRLVVKHGLAAISKEKPEALLAQIADDGVVRGRVRG